MFKKIRSNRDPRDTVLTELHREFEPHFGKAKTKLAKARRINNLDVRPPRRASYPGHTYTWIW